MRFHGRIPLGPQPATPVGARPQQSRDRVRSLHGPDANARDPHPGAHVTYPRRLPTESTMTRYLVTRVNLLVFGMLVVILALVGAVI